MIIIKFGRKYISKSDSVKLLGVLLDVTRSWRSQLVELSRKLARSAGIFYKLGHFVPLAALKSIYHALFLPYFVIWYYCLSSTSNQYWSLRKSLLELWPSVIPLLIHYLYFLIFRFLNLMIYIIYHHYVSSFVYECHNNLAPNHFSDYVTQVFDIHHHNTRSASHGDFFKEKEHFTVWFMLCLF